MAQPSRIDSHLCLLLAGGDVEVAVRGGSMAPTLASGSRVRVARARSLWPGDVVVFRSVDGPLVAHRLLGALRRRGEWYLLTKGDAASAFDDFVPVAAVVGTLPVTVSVRRRARALLDFARYALRAAGRRLR